jgi:hypothetical protein
MTKSELRQDFAKAFCRSILKEKYPTEASILIVKLFAANAVQLPPAYSKFQDHMSELERLFAEFIDGDPKVAEIYKNG